MNSTEFIKIIKTFADDPNKIERDTNSLLFEIHNETIVITTRTKDMTLLICEDEIEQTAEKWIVSRLAKLNQLADRIIDYIEIEKSFITPRGLFLDQIEKNPDEKERDVEDTSDAISNYFSEPSTLSSNVLYLTSDAGDGKSTLINHLALKQAKEFKQKKTGWLLLPIELGGRPFLRFDDIVIASLVNRFRFSHLYYNSFLELVKLGVIVPAFDGFEEMFVEASTGEALSALGNLMNELNSTGNILIAARKAYFDYKSFTNQARLFDTIKTNYITFSKLTIKRWNKKEFINYAEKRNLLDAEEIYNVMEGRLGYNHPIITRPVLVKQLLDIFTSDNDYDELLKKIGKNPHDYFSHFVEAIIEREATLKWIDRSGGDTYTPLITTSQHHDILALIAQEMWLNDTEDLSSDIFDLISELFSEEHNLQPSIANQVKERIKQHALIVSSIQKKNKFSFDHDEFRQYFLGESIARILIKKQISDIVNLFRKALVPQQAIETTIHYIKTTGPNIYDILELLNSINSNASDTSYVKMNCGSFVCRLINAHFEKTIILKNYSFPADSLLLKDISGITFVNCVFETTSLENTSLKNCKFENCVFSQIEIYESTEFEDIDFINTSCSVIYLDKNEISIYDPKQIISVLMNHSIRYPNEKIDIPSKILDIDENLKICDRIFRKFLRSTYLNEAIFKMRLGEHAQYFFDTILPDLLKHNILEETEYVGSGRQRRFKLNVKMEIIENNFKECNGDYNHFLDLF
jgi:hypothetical protein